MPAWMTIRQKYLESGRARHQADDDAIGGAILSGMGITNPRKNLGDFERRAFGEMSLETPMIERAMRVYRECGAWRSGVDYTFLATLPVPVLVPIDTAPGREDTDTAILAILEGYNPVFCWRSNGDPVAQWMCSLELLGKAGGGLTAPLLIYRVGAADPEVTKTMEDAGHTILVMRQSLKNYIRQGGPYDLG